MDGAQAEKPVIVITIERYADGRIAMRGTPADRVMIVGILEWAKTLVVSTKEESRIVPAATVPRIP